MFGQTLAVGCGGFLGSIVRWGIGEALGRAIPALPGGTLVANVVAGFVIGLVTGLDLARPLPGHTKLFLATGICGGLSTFSTFSNETFQLLSMGHVWTAALNIAANVISSLVAVAVGLAIARMLAAAA